jgi:Tol biopolymer transport system component
MYWGLYGGEFYFIQMKAGRWQIRAMNLRGESRLVSEVPVAGTEGRFAVYQNRIAYVESVGDSARIKVIAGPGRTPSTLGTFPKPTRSGEQVWSYDGRQLAVRLQGNPIIQLIYRFDAAGAVVGPPQSFTLPFEYWYETFWLPDGSGLTMIVQPPGMPMTHIALVKLSDPEHPILLTRADTNSKWGHSLSPDGKYVAYASQRERGSSIYLIDMAALVKQATSKL